MHMARGKSQSTLGKRYFHDGKSKHQIDLELGWHQFPGFLKWLHTSTCQGQLDHPCCICFVAKASTLCSHVSPKLFAHRTLLLFRHSHTSRQTNQTHSSSFYAEASLVFRTSKNKVTLSWSWSRSFYACRLVILDKQAISHLHLQPFKRVHEVHS